MTSRREQLLQELRDLEESQIEESRNDSEDDENRQNDVSQHDSQQEPQTDNNKVLAAKKPRSAKQLEVFARAQAKNKEKADARKQQKMIEDEEKQRVLQEKIVQKAIAIKKSQIKKEKVIESVPDVPVLLPKQKAVAEQKPVVPAGPVYRFY